MPYLISESNVTFPFVSFAAVYHLVAEVARCNKPGGLVDFIKLREYALSLALTAQQQSEILLAELRAATHKRKTSPYYVLCVIQMLIKHGKPDLLETLVVPNHLQTIDAILSSEKKRVSNEHRLKVAQCVKVYF